MATTDTTLDTLRAALLATDFRRGMDAAMAAGGRCTPAGEALYVANWRATVEVAARQEMLPLFWAAVDQQDRQWRPAHTL